mgnify:CR=1 FL=1
MPIWKTRLIEEARDDFKALDGRQKVLVAKQLTKLERDPYVGRHLGNKMGMDLTGYYKLYADGKRIRIVYSIVDDFIEVVAIGEREDMEVYRSASLRIAPKPQ